MEVKSLETSLRPSDAEDDPFFDAYDFFFSDDEPPIEDPSRSVDRRRSSSPHDPTAAIASEAISSVTDAGPPPEQETSSSLSLIDILYLPFSLPGLLLLAATDPLAAIDSIYAVLRDRVLPILRRIGLQEVAVRVALGLSWAAFVAIVLLWCLAMAFLLGWLVVVWIVEKPLRLEGDLVFDYTMASPVALVPLGPSCKGVSGELFGDDGGVGLLPVEGRRVIAVGNRMSLTVSMTLPESDYNRNLGMFQVRADFISSSGHILASSSRPCMLRFKSPFVRFLQTLLKSGLLLAGYTLESQNLRIEMKDFIEKADPTACVRIIIQSRAQFHAGIGIPEIYEASLVLESELPLVKRLLWCWRRTMFIWISLGFFLSELLVILLCCRPLIIPKMTVRRAS